MIRFLIFKICKAILGNREKMLYRINLIQYKVTMVYLNGLIYSFRKILFAMINNGIQISFFGLVKAIAIQTKIINTESYNYQNQHKTKIRKQLCHQI